MTIDKYSQSQYTKGLVEVIFIMNSLIKKRYVNKISDIEVKNKIKEFKVESELIKELSSLTGDKNNI